MIRRVMTRNIQAQGSQHVGRPGDVFVDLAANRMLISDGQTPGGVPIGSEEPGVLPQIYIGSYEETNNFFIEMEDLGKHIFADGDGTLRINIPRHSDIPFPLGTAFTAISGENSSIRFRRKTYEDETSDVSIIAADQGPSNFWTIPPNSIATVIKIRNNLWMVSGVGIFDND